MGRMQKQLSTSQLIILGFAGLILLGSFLLMLPAATRDGTGTPFSDALFTSTSAVCVTGLVVRDTATYWSFFGQAVILLLLQIGGMGVVTISVMLAMVSGRKISLRQRSTMQESISAHQMGGIVRLVGFIITASSVMELLGAALLSPIFCKEFGLWKGLWYGLFHSVSAFCNAGFDLMGVRETDSSLTAFPDHPMVNMTVMILIVVGGIGFATWDDIRVNGLRLKRYRMQTKVILLTTLGLIVVPAFYLFQFELNGLPLQERIWGALFQSVTTRTAGFNTLDLTRFSESGLAMMCILMLVGGSPGSTAGGMKTTTFAVLLSTAVSVFCRKEHTHFFGRRIAEETIREAATILTMYLVLFLTGGFVISRVENMPLLHCLFETASAIGTVGLTLGLTPNLGQLSRMILMALMYIGRVGGLTLIFSAVSPNQGKISRLPKEKLTVG